MKILYPAGSLLLAANALALLCAVGIWVDWLGRGDYLFWHLALMALVLLLPVFLWRHNIATNYNSLRLFSAGRRQEIFLADIDRIQVEFQGRKCVLSVYLSRSYLPALEADVTHFRRTDVKALLDDLKTKNAKIQVFTPANF